MSKRNTRDLHHLKASRVLLGSGLPKGSEGNDGDFALRLTKGGLKLYAKYQNKWYVVGEYMQEALPDERSYIKGSINPINALGSRTASLTQHGDLLLQNYRMISFDGSRAQTKLFQPDNQLMSGENTSLQLNVGNVQLMRFVDNGSGSVVVFVHAGGALQAKTLYLHSSPSSHNALSDTKITGTATSITLTPGSVGMVTLTNNSSILEADIDADIFDIASDQADSPKVLLKKTRNDATGPTITLQNNRGTHVTGQSNDVCGNFKFVGNNTASGGGGAENITYASIVGYIATPIDGAEGGGIRFRVASHDGEMVTGLIVADGSEEDEVDVTIANGENSRTVISGQCNKMFSVKADADNSGARLGAVNNWGVASNDLGSSIAAGDFGVGELRYNQYHAITACRLKNFTWSGYYPSAETYEMQLWDVTVPADGQTTAGTASNTGITLTVNGGSAVTSNAFYTVSATGLTYELAAGHQLYLVHRYTSGSGTKYVYGSTTLEFEII